MNEDHKQTGFAYKGKLLTAAFLCGTLLLGNGHANAAPTAPNENLGITEQMQTITVKGLVTDSNGEPIIGANVLEKGTSNGSLTDIDGKFTLNVRQGSTLQISFIGYKTQEIKAQQGSIKVVLVEDNEMLEEVVVVGYGSQKKVNVTGAVSTVDVNKALEAKPQMDVTKALQGVVPGLTILNTQGGINEQPSMTIRGVGTLSNSETSNPLIIVDGVPLDDLSLINPHEIPDGASGPERRRFNFNLWFARSIRCCINHYQTRHQEGQVYHQLLQQLCMEYPKHPARLRGCSFSDKSFA